MIEKPRKQSLLSLQYTAPTRRPQLNRTGRVGRRLNDPERHRSHRLRYGGHDPGVCVDSIGGQAPWALGYPEKGLALGTAALASAGRIARPFSLASALLFNGVLYLDSGDPEAALQLLGAAEALAAEQRLGLVVEPRFIRGAALSTQGAFEEAVACLREGLAGRLGAMQFRPFALARLAEALSRQDEYGAALMTARDGLKILEETGYRQQEADFHRLEGIALVGLDRLEEAKLPFKRRCASLERSRQNPMNSAPRRASRGCGANKGGRPKRGIYWHQFMAGSPKASTPPI